MNEAYQQILGYVVGVWRRRWYVIAIAWLICGAGWTMVASLPDKYESTARIYVDMDTMLGPLMRGLAVEMNLAQQIDLMQRTVFSRPNLEKISMLTDLDLRVTTPEEKDKMLDGLGKKLQLVQQGRNLFKVTYEDTDRQLTKRVVQAVLQIFVEGNLGASRKDMDTTRKFLADQLADYEKQLVDAESRLADFKRQNMGLMPGDRGYHEHLTTVSGDVERTQAYLDEANRVRDTLQQQLAEVPQYFTPVQSSGSQPAPMAMASGPQDAPLGPESDTALRIFEMQKSIDSLLMRYTENHPDVIVLKKKIEELKQQQKKETEERMKAQTDDVPIAPIASSGSDEKIPNPLYEQIKLQLVKQESIVAALKQRVESRKEELVKWQQMANTAPQVEAELARLTRDYDIIRKGYQELRARQESAKLARDLETKAQKVQFRIIDPPLVPIKPSGPNRPTYLSGVLIGGIAAGLAFAFLLAQVNSTFSTVQALRATFQLPVVGSVTAIHPPGHKWRRKRELFSFVVVCLGLVAAYGGLTAVEMMHKV
jgi:polysaccharide chain length determinant protein (PEP-CTERM system associated)